MKVIIMLSTLILILTTGAVIAVLAFGTHYILTSKNKIIISAWQEIKQTAARRRELILPMISIIKSHETESQSSFFDELVELTEQAKFVNSPEKLGEIETYISSLLGNVINFYNGNNVLVNDRNYTDLEYTLFEAEGKIRAARELYNSNVYSVNSVIEGFPMNIIAKKMNIREREYFNYEGYEDEEDEGEYEEQQEGYLEE